MKIEYNDLTTDEIIEFDKYFYGEIEQKELSPRVKSFTKKFFKNIKRFKERIKENEK